MPAKTTRRTLARQWELLKLLPSRGTGKTAAELTQALNAMGFRVSKRQVERDLWELYEAFHLECNEASPPYGWKWPHGANLDLPAMTMADALSLTLVQDTLKPLLPQSLQAVLLPRFALARQKLDSLRQSNAHASWPQKVRSVLPSQPMQPAMIDEHVMETVHDGLLQDRQIDISYLNMDSKAAAPLRLHPLGLVSRGHVSYLIATAWDYGDIRLYAMHRIRQATLTEAPVVRPSGFDLDTYIEQGALQFGADQQIRLRARVNDYLLRILSETPLADDQMLDGYLLTATVHDTWQLTWWILSQGAGIEVLAPAGLRQRIAQTLTQACGLYQLSPRRPRSAAAPARTPPPAGRPR